MGRGELPIPAHFEPETVGEIWRVDYQARSAEAEAWARTHAIGPAHEDRTRVGLLVVDYQNTFCVPGFELFVAGRSGRGAVEDGARLCAFIYRNLAAITRIHVTLDTHRAAQIFHPLFLIDEAGHHPPPMTQVTVADVETGRWRIDPEVAADAAPGADAAGHLLHYCRALRERGKDDLMIWPYHAMLGGIGHALVAAVEEAVFFHTIARRSQATFEVKGENPLTENYSALRPEVLEDASGRPIARANAGLVEKLASYDLLVMAGQAKSHCLAWTVEDLLEDLLPRDSELVKKLYLLEDCTSPVVVPGAVDFTDRADAAFRKFAAAGVNVVRSTDPITSWPGAAARLGG
jgi:nicotinamidase-related amidase